MAGIPHDPYAWINRLIQLLDEQYDTSTILKELVQNADDSSSGTLWIGYHPGLPDGKHPLLQQHALIVVNDGSFSEKDLLALPKLNNGSKADDLDSIGKFGLGLKSVFNICEAFFYLGSSQQPGMIAGLKDETYDTLYCPWEGTDYHKEWIIAKDNKTAIVNQLNETISNFPHKLEKWFCIWIPLRMDDNQTEVRLTSEVPSGLEICNIKNAPTIAAYMPLMKCLKHFSMSDLSHSDTNNIIFSLRRSEQPESRSLFRTDQNAKAQLSKAAREFYGQVDCYCLNGIEWSYFWFGLESYSLAEEFKSLKVDQKWPNSLASAKTTGSSKIDDKSDSHGAYIIGTYTEPLKIYDDFTQIEGVFLPISDAEIPIWPTRYTAMVHGIFFIDSGRKHITLRKDGDGVNIPIQWNELLRNILIYPLLLPTLYKASEYLHWDLSTTDRITEALQKKISEGNAIQFVCKDYKWMKLLRPSYSEWKLLNRDDSHYVLPPFKFSTDKLRESIKAMDQFLWTHNVRMADTPGIYTNSGSDWNEHIDEILSSVDLDMVYTNDDTPKFLIDWLTSIELTIQSKKILRDKIQTLLSRSTFDYISGWKKELQSFINLSGEIENIYFRPDIYKSFEVFVNMLNGKNIGILILPEFLKPDNWVIPVSINAVYTILVQTETIEVRPGDFWKLTSHLFSTLEREDMKDIINKISLNVWPAIKYDSNNNPKPMKINRDKLMKAIENKLVVSSDTNLIAISNATADTEIFLIETTDDNIKNIGSIPITSSDRNYCVQFINRKPYLNDNPVRRGSLLTVLLSQDIDTSCKEAIRYLLHAYARDTNDKTLYYPNAELDIENNLLTGVMFSILQINGEEWRLIDHEMIMNLNDYHKMRLQIVRLTYKLLAEEIQNIGVDKLNAIQYHLGEIEYTSLLNNLYTDDDINWLALPFHLNQDGTRSKIHDRNDCYISNAEHLLLEHITKIPQIIQFDVDLQQRYEKTHIRKLTHLGLINIYLNQDVPGNHWNDILDILPKIKPAIILFKNHNLEDDSFEAHVINKLCSTKWLPLQDQSFGSLSQLIILEGIQNYVDHIAEYTTDQQIIITKIFLIEDFTIMSESAEICYMLAPNVDKCFELFAEAITFGDKYQIGNLHYLHTQHNPKFDPYSVIDSAERCNVIKSILFITHHTLPGLKLLKLIHNDQNYNCYFNMIANALSKPPPLKFVLEEMNTILAIPNPSSDIHRLYKALLFDLHHYGKLNVDNVSNITFISKTGKWQTPDKLVLRRYQQIDDNYILEEEIEDYLKEYFSLNNDTIDSQEIYKSSNNACRDGFQESHKILREFFKTWEGFVKRPMIGAFISILGSRKSDNSQLPDENLILLANDYLGKFGPVDDFLEKLQWIIPQGITATGANRTIQQTVHEMHFTINIVQYTGNEQKAQTLDGQIKVFPLKDTITSIVDMDVELKPNRVNYVLNLRYISNPDQVSNLSQILMKNIEHIYYNIYLQPVKSLEQKIKYIFSELDDYQQLDLRVSQIQILNHCKFYLAQLSVKSIPEINQILNDLDMLDNEEARRLVETERHSHVSKNGIESIHKPEESRSSRKHEIYAKLQTIFEKNDQLCKFLVEKVKQKIHQSQYQPYSVPFELFQNADDSLVQLQELNLSPITSLITIEMTEHQFRFRYRGRVINAKPVSDLSTAEMYKRGYGDDLLKMLILSGSDKGGNNENVTGKFGMGFKSVYLISSMPSIISGDLCFAIRGGMYPIKLIGDTYTAMSEWANDIPGDKKYPATMIELPVDENIETRKISTYFYKCASLLTIFAKQTKQLHLTIDNISDQIEWKVDTDCEYEGIEFGTVTSNTEPVTYMLVTNCEGTASLLLKINASGFQSLPLDIPNFWVTTPIMQSGSGCGFAINAAFQIDIGRAQIANNDYNKLLASKLGKEFASTLQKFISQLKNGSTLPASLSKINLDRIKDTLWDVLNNTSDTSSEVLNSFLGIDGTANLYTTGNNIPTGLPDPYSTYSSLERIKYSASGLLMNQELFKLAASLPGFINKFQVGSIIHNSKAMVVKKYHSDILPLTLHQSFQSLFNDGQLNADYCKRLVLFLDLLEKNPAQYQQTMASDYEDSIEWLKDVKLQAQDDNWVFASRLLYRKSGNHDQHEISLLYAFAPARHLLSKKYGDAATKMIQRLAPGNLTWPDVNVIKHWGQEVQNDTQKNAFLNYILHGDRKIAYTNQEKSGYWLSKLTYQQLLDDYDYDENDAQMIASYLSITIPRESNENVQPKIANQLMPANPDKLLQIYEWWKKESQDWLPKYNISLYPNGLDYLKQISKMYPDTPQQKAAWFKLLLRSSLETIGRSKPEGLRGFMEILDDQKFINWMHEENYNPSIIFQGIHGYLNNQIQDIAHHQCLPYFYTMSIAGFWLDEYITTLLRINEVEDFSRFTPEHYLNPRMNQEYRPGDPSAPPLIPILGIGSCFLLRELVRSKAIDNPVVHPFCFVPSKQVVNLLQQCGVSVTRGKSRLQQSKEIYDQLTQKLDSGKALFHSSFDIPFRVISSKTALQQQFQIQTQDDNDD